jgi:hypothetical protein
VSTKKVGYSKAEWASLNRAQQRGYGSSGGARGSRDRTPESGSDRGRCSPAYVAAWGWLCCRASMPAWLLDFCLMWGWRMAHLPSVAGYELLHSV